MRRQTQPHGLAARWSLRPLDLDPHGLPVRYALPVNSGPEQPRQARDLVEIKPGSVAVRHDVNGCPPVGRVFALDDFSGIAIRIESLDAFAERFAVSVNLHHADPKLCFPLYMSGDMKQAGERWQGWARALQLPLLLPETDGGWREPVERFGKLAVGAPHARPPRLALASRRSCISAYREAGNHALVHNVGGRELIARS